jgi:hypothetical protein
MQFHMSHNHLPRQARDKQKETEPGELFAQVAAISRLPCGFPGVTKTQCEKRGCCFDDSQPTAAWCFEPSAVAEAEFVMAAFADPIPAELTGAMHNLSLPRRNGGGACDDRNSLSLEFHSENARHAD